MTPSLPLPPNPATEDQLRAYGEALGAALAAPAVVALRGDLGAGKTTLAQAIARGAGVTADVTSPTFALVHEYAGAHSPVFHLDLYRLKGPGDLVNLGWDDILAANAIVLIEWAERAGPRLGGRRLDVTLRERPADPARREVEVAWVN